MFKSNGDLVAVLFEFHLCLTHRDYKRVDNNVSLILTIFILKEIIPVSGWEILKLNSPEWLYLIVGSIAAFTQGACFPVFALLFGFTSAVSFFLYLLKILKLSTYLFTTYFTVPNNCVSLHRNDVKLPYKHSLSILEKYFKNSSLVLTFGTR